MPKIVEIIIAGAIVAIVLLATYTYLNIRTRRIVKKNFDTPEEALTAARVYLKYKRREAAIDLLEHALTNHPSHPELQAMLDSLTARENDTSERS